MRTTVRLNDALLSQAKREAAKRHQTLTSLIEQGLRLVLAESRSPRKKRRHVVLLTSGAGGLQPGVDLDNNAALLDIMEHPLNCPPLVSAPTHASPSSLAASRQWPVSRRV